MFRQGVGLFFRSYIFSLTILAACAGPTTPFGALSQVHPETTKSKDLLSVKPDQEPSQIDRSPNLLKKTESLLLGSGARPTIRFSPARQLLHGPTNLVVTIHDDLGITSNPDITVLYNGYDLTQRFMAQAKSEVAPNARQMTMAFPNLRMLPDRDNKVEIVYRHSKFDAYAFGRYLPPECKVFEESPVLATEGFHLPASLLKSIQRLSTQQNINSSFMAGLIAQESGFDNHAVSSSKAIGLTQITSVAEQEVSKHYANWPRYDDINLYPFPIIKTMIIAGAINSKNEWRLDPQLSIRGGLAYLNFLANYWRRPENYAKIVANFKNPDEGLSEVVLASYNSGFVRVADAIDRRGVDWLKDYDLKEARKYVNRVMSYCYHFSHQGDDDANST